MKKNVIINVLIKYIPLILLKIVGAAGTWECSSLEETRYNPFKSYRYDKYSQPDNESFDEIHQLENLLNNCKRYTFHELGSQIKNSNEQLSIMFKNIDGVTSNFDLFSTELMLKNEELSILTLAETNLDECNKNIFKLQGFESIYQSKIVGKHKGSGLAIYIKEAFLFTKLDAFSQCSSNLESLFISINNTENPITVGVLYRPPSGDTTLFISELNSILQKGTATIDPPTIDPPKIDPPTIDPPTIDPLCNYTGVNCREI